MMDILWILWTLPSVLAVEGKMFLPVFCESSILPADRPRVYGHGTLVSNAIQEIRHESILAIIPKVKRHWGECDVFQRLQFSWQERFPFMGVRDAKHVIK